MLCSGGVPTFAIVACTIQHHGYLLANPVRHRRCPETQVRSRYNHPILGGAASVVRFRTCPSLFTSRNGGAGFFGVRAASTSTPLRERFLCPECGKRFLCAANLMDHRSVRHAVHVVTVGELAQEKLTAQNAELELQLTKVLLRVRELRKRDAAPRYDGIALDSTLQSSGAALHFPSAVPTGRLMEVDEKTLQAWQRSKLGLGTGVSLVRCVGTVVGPVQVGVLRGASSLESTAANESGSAVAGVNGPRVLQFTLEVHGYRERRPGQLKMFQARILVRHIAPHPVVASQRNNSTAEVPKGEVSAVDNPGCSKFFCSPSLEAYQLFKVAEGDVVSVQGHYALHCSYDMVSKQSVENAVLEVNTMGLLRAVSSETAGMAGNRHVTAPGNRCVESQNGEQKLTSVSEDNPCSTANVSTPQVLSHTALGGSLKLSESPKLVAATPSPSSLPAATLQHGGGRDTAKATASASGPGHAKAQQKSSKNKRKTKRARQKSNA